MYAIQDVMGKGKGLVAIEDIPKGTRILQEKPIITIPKRQQDGGWLTGWFRTHISQEVESLSEHLRQSFLSMHNIYPYENVAEQSLGIFRTNALPIETNGIGAGIFLEACRINHACDNNAHKDWNQRIQRHTVHALRDIPKGEEITIHYLGIDSSREVRQKILQDRLDFLCSCRLCSLPTEQSRESDKRLERIQHLDDLVGHDGNRLIFTLQTLRYVDERVRLYNEQGPGDAGLSRAYMDAAQIAIANGDLARGRIFAKRAVEGWRTSCGDDCKEVIEHSPLAQNPAKLSLYGLSMDWKTSLNEVPRELDPDSFEDWLWRRQKPKKRLPLGQSGDLRNREIFPGYAALPNRNSANLDSSERVDSPHQPARPWYFLGEIIGSTMVDHLALKLTDVDDKKVTLHFSKDERGKELSPAQIQKGFTVAVPYAKRDASISSDPAIHHDEPQILKILPVSLKKLLELNDQMQHFSREVDGTRTCHGCGKETTSPKRCGNCSCFWYCNKVCQKAGWIEKNHKIDCKLMCNSDVCELFLLK